MRKHLLFLIILISSLCLASDRFILQSELRTGYSSGTSSKLFTMYTCDADGKRLLKRVFDGMDSTSALLSREIYTYDTQSRLIQSMLVSATSETLSIVTKSYSSDDLSCISTLNKDRALRFKDTLIYNNGRLSEQRRYNSLLTMTFFKRFSYSSALLSSDTLFESDGSGGYSATKAFVFNYNPDSTVAKEIQWLKQDGTWYAISTSRMTYLDDHLSNVSTFETDGTSGRLIDSLDFKYDSFGNRTKERKFDNEGILEYEIVFSWFDTKPMSVPSAVQMQLLKPEIVFKNNSFSFDQFFTGTVAIYTPTGCKISNNYVKESKIVPLAVKPVNGRYILKITGTFNRAITFTINN